MQKKKWLGAVIGFVVLALVITATAVIYVQTRPKTDDSTKTVTVKIVYDDEEHVHVITTKAEFLRGPLDEKQLVSGEESQTGLFIKEANGRKADDAKQEWWCITKDGEMLMTGVETTPITDGDTFEITLKIGYDLF